MIFLVDILQSFAGLVQMILGLYKFIIIGAVILSWVNADPYNPIVRIIHQVTDPTFRLARRIMPRILFRTGLDFSPIIALFMVVLAERLIVRAMLIMAQSLASY